MGSQAIILFLAQIVADGELRATIIKFTLFVSIGAFSGLIALIVLAKEQPITLLSSLAAISSGIFMSIVTGPIYLEYFTVNTACGLTAATAMLGREIIKYFLIKFRLDKIFNAIQDILIHMITKK